jgi:hypothetical protein
MAKVFAAFPKGTTGEQIVDFWIAQMEEDLARVKEAAKKAEEKK